MEQQNNFDILDYLNDIYMKSVGPQIDVLHAGGHFNRHDNNDKVDEEILEINKKRIDIPNAKIKQFSYQQQGDVEEYNEPKTTRSSSKRSRKNGIRHNEVSDEGEQERSVGGPLAEEVVTI